MTEEAVDFLRKRMAQAGPSDSAMQRAASIARCISEDGRGGWGVQGVREEGEDEGSAVKRQQAAA